MWACVRVCLFVWRNIRIIFFADWNTNIRALTHTKTGPLLGYGNCWHFYILIKFIYTHNEWLLYVAMNMLSEKYACLNDVVILISRDAIDAELSVGIHSAASAPSLIHLTIVLFLLIVSSCMFLLSSLGLKIVSLAFDTVLKCISTRCDHYHP